MGIHRSSRSSYSEVPTAIGASLYPMNGTIALSVPSPPATLQLILRRQDFLNTYLVNQVLTPQVYQIRPLFIVGQIRADACGHCHHETVVIHI
jgi:hypothetical protein